MGGGFWGRASKYTSEEVFLRELEAGGNHIWCLVTVIILNVIWRGREVRGGFKVVIWGQAMRVGGPA